MVRELGNEELRNLERENGDSPRDCIISPSVRNFRKSLYRVNVVVVAFRIRFCALSSLKCNGMI